MQLSRCKAEATEAIYVMLNMKYNNRFIKRCYVNGKLLNLMPLIVFPFPLFDRQKT